MNNIPFSMEGLDDLIRSSLAEDIGGGDVTTLALVDPRARIVAEIQAREPCRVAGGVVAREVFHQLDPTLETQLLATDGDSAEAGQGLVRIVGGAASILTAERTALNFMQRMVGIATFTARFVDAVKPFGVRILDTRKTTPGLRMIEKYSVRCGGGENHRFGLFDRVLIKDNHRKLWSAGDTSRLDRAVDAARQRFPDRLVEIEVESLEELHVALRGKPDWVLLDNMPTALLRQCVAAARGIALSEASGGITLDTIRDVAATGVDAISLGCLTHSAPSADLSLEWVETLDRGNG